MNERIYILTIDGDGTGTSGRDPNGLAYRDEEKAKEWVKEGQGWDRGYIRVEIIG